MPSLLEQLKHRRLALGLKQHDMMLRVGMSRQQYQRLESRGNPRLDTLELVAEGLNSDLMLIPREKRPEVMAILDDTSPSTGDTASSRPEEKPLSDDPWHGLLGDTDE